MIRLYPYVLPLVRPWTDAGLTLTERRGVLVRLGTDGVEGWGDCAPLPGRTEDLATALRSLKASGHGPAARCALETARLDLAARRAGIPLARLLAADASDSVAVNAALGGLDDGCVARARAAAAAGFAVAKVKVGLADPGVEIAYLRALAAAVPLRLRLDANRAWDETTARSFLGALAGLPIEAVEEPLADPNAAALGWLQAPLPFPLAVDESLATLGLDSVLACGIRRLVLKPVELGGPAAALAVARRARAAGLEVVVTSALDSAVGVVAAAHLAAALGDDGPAHGLATLDWLAFDTAPRPRLSGGRLFLPAGAGLGLVPFRQPA